MIATIKRRQPFISPLAIIIEIDQRQHVFHLYKVTGIYTESHGVIIALVKVCFTLLKKLV